MLVNLFDFASKMNCGEKDAYCIRHLCPLAESSVGSFILSFAILFYSITLRLETS